MRFSGIKKSLIIALKLKKLIVLALLATLSINHASAQRDLIITQAGEEIRCRILDETPTRFVYAYVNNSKVLRNEIFKNLVTSFKYNFYETDLVKSKLLPGDDKSDGGSSKRVDTRRTKTVKENKKDRKKDKTKENDENPSKAFSPSKEVEDELKNNDASASKELKADAKLENNDALKGNNDLKKINGEEKKDLPETQKVNKVTKQDEPAQESLKQAIITKNEQSNKKEVSSSVAEKVLDKGAKPVVNQKGLSKKDLKKIEKEKEKEEKHLEKVAKEEKDLEKKALSKLENKELLETPEVENDFKNYLKYRVGVRGGISNVFGSKVESTNAYDLYREQLLKGWTFGADAAYFITESFGIGGMFTNYMSQNKAEGLNYPNLVTKLSVDNGSISNKVSQKFAGPVLLYRKAIDYKTFVVLGVSPGLNFYEEKGAYNTENFDFKAKQFGGSASLGLDFLLGNDIIGRDIILSLEAGYNYARFNEIDYGGIGGVETLTSPMNLDRLDFSIGLRFMRFPKYLKLSSY